jgi:hypothetical protein
MMEVKYLRKKLWVEFGFGKSGVLYFRIFILFITKEVKYLGKTLG